MKLFKKVAFLTIAVSTAIVGLAGCKSNAKMPVNFVAVTSSTYDAEVQFGNYDYKFKGKVDQKSNSFTLEAIAQQRHSNASGGNGMGGWGNFGGWGGNSGSQEEADPNAPVVHVESIAIVKEKQNNNQQGGGMPAGPFSLLPRREGEFQPPVGGGQGAQKEYEDIESLTIETGKDDTVTIKFTPENATNQKIQWSTSNSAVATVSDGKITGVGRGTAIITAKSEDNPNAIDFINVTVTKTDVSGVSLDKTSETLFINETKSLKATVEPANASISDVEWSTSDEKVVTVSSGSITGVAEGKATITVKSKDNPSYFATCEVEVKVENLAEHNKVFKGTYTVDGYGYVLRFKNDGNATGNEETVLHVDFNRTEGRHEFYYQVNLEGTQKLVKFQAKDPTFKDRLAKDYKSWDERDSSYIFRATATGNNNSVATAYLYMHSDGTAVLNTPSGTERNITIGLTWKLENGVFTVVNGNNTYTSMKSKNSAKPGYSISMGSYTFLLSENPDVKWKKLDVVDFIGESKYEFQGSYTDNTPDKTQTNFHLYLLSDGSAYLFSGWVGCGTGTYTESNGVFTIHMTYQKDGENISYDATSQVVGDTTQINVTAAFLQQRGPNTSWATISCDVSRIK